MEPESGLASDKCANFILVSDIFKVKPTFIVVSILAIYYATCRYDSHPLYCASHRSVYKCSEPLPQQISYTLATAAASMYLVIWLTAPPGMQK